MLYIPHLLREVIAPACDALAPHARSDEDVHWLMLVTALVESRATFLRQVPSGPALGLWQVEPKTHRWIVETVAKPLRTRLSALTAALGDDRELIWNLRYSCAVARLRYYLAPTPIPPAGMIIEQARYWKEHYNTPAGKGSVESFIAADAQARRAMRAERR